MKPDGFVDIPGFEGRYAAHPDGLIFSYGFKGRFAMDRTNKNPVGKLLRSTLDKKGYPTVMLRSRKNGQKRVFVHHLILETFVGPRLKGFESDHINRCPADNRSINLRWVTKSINIRNQLRKSKLTKYRGLAFDRKARNKWRAQCVDLNGKVHCVRGFETDKEAAYAYDKLAVSLLGHIAITNQSLGLLPIRVSQ